MAKLPPIKAVACKPLSYTTRNNLGRYVGSVVWVQGQEGPPRFYTIVAPDMIQALPGAVVKDKGYTTSNCAQLAIMPKGGGG